jgi:DNA-binding MarR family transcriptional regulator
MKDEAMKPGLRYQALLELLRTAETLWNASRIFFARWNLSPSQFNVLNLLYDQSAGCSQAELSRQLIMHRSNVTGLVDRLELRGLVKREDSPSDRRAFIVLLTPAGRKLIRKIQPHYYEAAETIWHGMPVKRAEQLVAELQDICRSAEGISHEIATKELP